MCAVVETVASHLPEDTNQSAVDSIHDEPCAFRCGVAVQGWSGVGWGWSGVVPGVVWPPILPDERRIRCHDQHTQQHDGHPTSVLRHHHDAPLTPTNAGQRRQLKRKFVRQPSSPAPRHILPGDGVTTLMLKEPASNRDMLTTMTRELRPAARRGSEVIVQAPLAGRVVRASTAAQGCGCWQPSWWPWGRRRRSTRNQLSYGRFPVPACRGVRRRRYTRRKRARATATAAAVAVAATE